MTPPDEAMRRIVTVLQQLKERLEEEVQQLVATLDTQQRILQNTANNAQQVADIRRQVADVAERFGVPDVVAALRAELPAVVEEAIKQSGVPPEYAANIQGDLLQALSGQEQEVARVIAQGTSEAVAQSIRQSITGAIDVRSLQRQVANALDVTLTQAGVALDRAVREVQDRALIAAGKAASEDMGEDVFVYVYAGPDDGVIRPYCAARVDSYLTQEQADALDPRERFNCRHTPSPLPLSIAKERGIQPFTE